ncbi:hypothetical protein EJ02DRAFT_72107 [Clathrospora elynae]|uniref:Secreted peptide n=1 Tax=Clathrospora elynae TaxID=706981 RepID=A0A6A5SZR1_9PLEO|nr:hypothetical protein EJ02DRAFT_72107 [Clathrospora elynae]
MPPVFLLSLVCLVVLCLISAHGLGAHHITIWFLFCCCYTLPTHTNIAPLRAFRHHYYSSGVFFSFYLLLLSCMLLGDSREHGGFIAMSLVAARICSIPLFLSFYISLSVELTSDHLGMEI